MHKQYIDFKQGMHDSIPICIAFLFLFTSIGILFNLHHYTFLQTTLMTMTVFSAPLQAILLQTAHNGLTIGAIIITACVINFRFFMMSTTLIPFFQKNNLFKTLLTLPMLSASSFTVTYTKFKTNSELAYFPYYLGVATVAYAISIISTILGYTLVTTLDSVYLTKLLSMALPIHFTILTAQHWPKLKPIIATLLGGGFMFLFRYSNNQYIFLIVPLLVGLVMSFYDLLKNQIRKSAHE